MAAKRLAKKAIILNEEKKMYERDKIREERQRICP
jgi:hypothetical protein